MSLFKNIEQKLFIKAYERTIVLKNFFKGSNNILRIFLLYTDLLSDVDGDDLSAALYNSINNAIFFL